MIIKEILGREILDSRGNPTVEVDLITANGEPFTAHTTNPVPFIFVSKEKYNLENGGLRDIAPTILEIMDIPKPAIMTGKSLLKKIER